MTYHGHGIPRKMSRTEAFKSLWNDPNNRHMIMKAATILMPIELVDDLSGIGVIDDPILLITAFVVWLMVKKRRKQYLVSEPDPWHIPPHYNNRPHY